METIMEAPQKLKIKLPHGPAIPLLGIYPKECKLHYNKGTSTPMFIVAIVIIDKLWKSQDAPQLRFKKM
jgi:hypothetical protein